MKMYSKENQTMVDVKKLGVEGNEIVMVAKLMDAYSMKIYLRPADLRESLSLLTLDVVKAIPEMLVSGTKNEEKLRKLGTSLSKLGSENLDILLGKNSKEKVDSVTKAMGAATLDNLFESLLLILQLLLENAEPAK